MFISLVRLCRSKVHSSVIIHIGVGFCVARSDLMGSAKASKSGMSDEYRLPRFFYVLLSYVISQALESRQIWRKEMLLPSGMSENSVRQMAGRLRKCHNKV